MEALADASFLIALHLAEDPHRGRAKGLAERSETILWNTISFVETHYRLATLAGAKVAGERMQEMAQSAYAKFALLNEQDLIQALSLAERHRLTTNDAVMASHAMRLKVPILSFDADFRRVEGLEVVA